MTEDAGASDPNDAPSDGPLPGDAARQLADEARKVLSAVQDWAQRTMPEPPPGHGGPECQWCPLCQFASILRGEHPGLADRAAEAGTAVLGAVRALLDSATSHAAPPARGAQGSPAPDPMKPGPAPRVQRIRLDDES